MLAEYLMGGWTVINRKGCGSWVWVVGSCSECGGPLRCVQS